MSSDLVRYSVSGGIVELMLDRAPVNALSMPLIDALLAALTRARDDETVRAVIIGSARKVFCAGLDLDLVRGKPGIETKKFLEKLYFALNDMQYRMGEAHHCSGRRRCARRRHDACDLLWTGGWRGWLGGGVSRD